MKLKISLIIILTTAALSCGFMEDFYALSGSDVKTSVYVQNAPFLYISHDGGKYFSEIDMTAMVKWYVNPYRECLILEVEGTNYNFYILTADGKKKYIGSMGNYVTLSNITAALNGDFYFLIYDQGKNQLWKVTRDEPSLKMVTDINIVGFAVTETTNFRALTCRGSRYFFISEISSNFRSSDEGKTFTPINSLSGNIIDMICRDSVIYAAGTTAIYYSNDCGSTFSAYSNSPEMISSLAADNEGRVYAASGMSLFFNDGGTTWSNGLSPAYQVYGLDVDYKGRVYLLTSNSLLASDDRGEQGTEFRLNTITGTRMQVVSYPE